MDVKEREGMWELKEAVKHLVTRSVWYVSHILSAALEIVLKTKLCLFEKGEEGSLQIEWSTTCFENWFGG